MTFVSAKHAENIRISSNIISIRDPGDTQKFASTPKSLLILEFHDVDSSMHNDGNTLFAHNHALKVLKFISDCKGEDIIVHCHAGMSRSAAVARFISEQYGYRLVLDKPCIGTTEHYNSRVYGTLRIAEMERQSKSFSAMVYS